MGEVTLGLEFRGVDVATQNYITRMTARKDGDDIVVWFATPTTGNDLNVITTILHNLQGKGS